MQRFTVAGAIPVIKFKNSSDKYIALVKRTPDAINSPDMHSGFFGTADESDNNDPLITANREFAEEFLILEAGKLQTFCIGENYLPTTREKVEGLVGKWEKILNFDPKQLIKKLNVVYIHSPFAEQLDMDDEGATKRIYLVEINLDTKIDEVVFVDCEDYYGKILDRRIDLFKVEELMNWWASQAPELQAKNSFQKAKKITSQSISKTKVSSLLRFALDNSRYLRDKVSEV